METVVGVGVLILAGSIVLSPWLATEKDASPGLRALTGALCFLAVVIGFMASGLIGFILWVLAWPCAISANTTSANERK